MIYTRIQQKFNSYSGKKCIIGYTYNGRAIFAFHVGSIYGNQTLSVYAIHGREWITAELALKHIAIGVEKGGAWIVPLANPDGAEICQAKSPLWKANGMGVDLNVNFDAEWGSGRLNTKQKGAANAIGDRPFSEPETRALRDFTIKLQPQATLSWHTKGEEIYWEFGGKGNEDGAKLLSQATGYAYRRIYGSAGGFKDWCIQKLSIPSYTIECGNEKLTHPIKDLNKLRPCFQALNIFTNQFTFGKIK